MDLTIEEAKTTIKTLNKMFNDEFNSLEIAKDEFDEALIKFDLDEMEYQSRLIRCYSSQIRNLADNVADLVSKIIHGEL